MGRGRAPPKKDRRVFTPGADSMGWCDTDGVPVLGPRCGICGAEPRRIRLSPPSDIRPCSEDGLRLLSELLERDYGCGGLLDDRLVLLNKTAGGDRTDEVYVDGRLFGVLEFDLKEMDYGFRPKLDGAGILVAQEGARRRTVVCDKGRLGGRHLKGKRIAARDILEFPAGVRAGEPVLITVGNLKGHGIALRDGPRDGVPRDGGSKDGGPVEGGPSDGGPASEPWVRVREIGHPEGALGVAGSDLERAVEANREHLRTLESRAAAEVRRAAKDSGLPVNVGFSGGKDSLALVGIAREVRKDVPLIFSDTGLEFPETTRYVRGLARDLGLELMLAEGRGDFWTLLEEFGPPGKDYRWCCKTQKLSPIASLVARRYPGGCLTLDGRRRYESVQRARISAVEDNPFVPGQRIASPIRDWRALEVWLYALYKGLPMNPLYQRDFERIGCWLCPSAPVAEIEKLSRTHPELYRRWRASLDRWAEKNGLDRRFVDRGMWRWRDPPPKVRRLAEEMDVALPPEAGEGELEGMRMPPPVDRCGAGGLTVDTRLRLPPRASIGKVAQFLRQLGEVKLAEDLGVVTLDADGLRATLHGSGHLVVRGQSTHHLEQGYRDIITAVMLAGHCTSCGVCAERCPRGAIEVSDGVVVDPRKCDGCLTCRDGCVVVTYLDKLPAPALRDGKAK